MNSPLVPDVRGSKRSECAIPPGALGHDCSAAAAHGITSTAPFAATTTAVTTSSFCARVRLHKGARRVALAPPGLALDTTVEGRTRHVKRHAPALHFHPERSSNRTQS
jgi:hypothetical protein